MASIDICKSVLRHFAGICKNICKASEKVKVTSPRERCHLGQLDFYCIQGYGCLPSRYLPWYIVPAVEMTSVMPKS